jgi:hypothetical protein
VIASDIHGPMPGEGDSCWELLSTLEEGFSFRNYLDVWYRLRSAGDC